jgi:hypothetical protein
VTGTEFKARKGGIKDDEGITPGIGKELTQRGLLVIVITEKK